MTQTPRRSSGDLFGDNPTKVIVDELDDPKPNSREDTGFTRPGDPRPDDVDKRPPDQKAFGKRSPGPDPVPVNVCSNAIQILDARKFVTWIHDQDIAIHEDVTVGHVLVALSGWGTESLAWLCRACRQAGRAPAPEKMRAAWVAKDVGLLRSGEDPEKTDESSQKS